MFENFDLYILTNLEKNPEALILTQILIISHNLSLEF